MMLRANSVWIAVAFSVTCFSAVAEPPGAAEYPITKEIPAIDTDRIAVPEQTVTINEESGWIVVTLETAPAVVEWQIVLAKADPNLVPTIDIHPTLPTLSIQYGPYFIRESADRLRVLRERKDPRDDSWAVLGNSEGKAICDASASRHRTFVTADGDWLWACTAPDKGDAKIDARIRFQHVDLLEGHGSMSLAGGLTEVFCGDVRCHNEGDLLVANRMRSYKADEILKAIATEKTLVGNPMPTVTGETVSGVATSFRLADVKGKVVLVDFWATWCAPCVKKLPEVESLSQKYRDQGFLVVGVHSSTGAGEIEKFLGEHEVSFPVIIDNGNTAKSYAVSAYPTYFLVGRNGKVVLGFENEPPTAEQIEAELGKRHDEP
jgi:thiol-disulfide isomerase/thioredoxin